MAMTKIEREKQKQERLGEVRYNNSGERMTIVEYNSSKDITVQFDNGYRAYKIKYPSFEKGNVLNPINKAECRVGLINYNKWGDKMTIIEYNDARSIIVQFEDKSTIKTQYSKFKDGCVKKPEGRLGEIRYNNSGDRMTIIEYNAWDNVIVLFDNGLTSKVTYRSFSIGNVKNPINKKQGRIGEISYNTYGSKMTIIEYNNSENITVQFENGYEMFNMTYDDFKKGLITNPYDKTVYGVGCLGEGEYKPTINGKITPQYTMWRGMIRRCYDSKTQETRPKYKDCCVVPEWHNFQTFCKFFSENWYEISGQRMALDKDILIKNNKVYSKENCLIVPNEINTLFVVNDANRGEYPVGVTFDKGSNKYIARCSTGLKNSKSLGHYNTPEQAFESYKIAKMEYIQQVADKYKNRIPEKVYNAMINYKIEITD